MEILISLLVSLLVGLFLREAYAWLDSLAKWIVRRVAKQLPEDLREDFIEQFTADLNALPNSILKILFAFRDGVMAASSMRDAVVRNQVSLLAEGLDRTFEKLTHAEAGLEEARASFEVNWRSSKEFVAARNRPSPP